jgi:hypothetical protein
VFLKAMVNGLEYVGEVKFSPYQESSSVCRCWKVT